MFGASVWQIRRRPARGLWAALFFTCLGWPALQAGLAQAPARPAVNWLQTVPAFPLATPASVGGLVIRQRSATLQPFTVAGECGAFVGQGDGSLEAWNWPIKIFTNLHITAALADYPVPIDVNQQSEEITVQPDHTTITFSHAAFVVREILFAPRCTHEGEPGVVALFQVSSSRPLRLSFSLTPAVKQMWPAPNYDTPSPEWVPLGPHSGYYILHTESDTLTGALAMPETEPGILEPYQERPEAYPLQFILHYDPARDGDRYFPLLLAAGNTAKTASLPALTAQLKQMAAHVPQMYQETAAYYQHFFDTRLLARTPDPRLDQALQWAEVSIDQLRVRHDTAQFGEETGLVAGLYNSGDSDRPGFGWFFGRDSLYTLYAVDSYGDFPLVREELDFLLKRQRADGKIMHEYSQTAELVDWAHLPYEYAAADSTPLLLMLLRDYALRSGDVAYLKQHWAQIALAWNFERTHDSDGDGIYDNAQGTGWVESWPPGMPHQEIYLAALDEQASQAYAQLTKLVGKTDDGASARAKAVAATLEREYRPDAESNGMWAFSYNGMRNGAPVLDRTATIFPTVAWWDGTYELPDSAEMFTRWASDEFATDWGARSLGDHDSFYDPISYHQGSVWPLFTGWLSLAEYRSGRPLAGYQQLMQNADLTWAQDLGAVTELLSGAYFEPMGRSTTHQLWSSAMVLAPALRGLFGAAYDAETHTLTVDPHLPAAWNGARLEHVPAGEGKEATLVMTREAYAMAVRVEGVSGVTLRGPGGSAVKAGVLRIPLPGVELSLPASLPVPGAPVRQPKVLAESVAAHQVRWVLSAPGGTVLTLPLRENGPHLLHAEGAQLVQDAPPESRAPLEGNALLAPGDGGAGPGPMSGEGLEIQFPQGHPQGQEYVQKTVTVSW